MDHCMVVKFIILSILIKRTVKVYQLKIIIYRVRIVRITNISGGFMVFDTLSLLNAYQIVNNNSGMSYRYLYCHLYKALTTPCAQDIILNYVAYLDIVEELPTDSNRQIHYGDSRDNTHSVKVNIICQDLLILMTRFL